MKDRQVGMEPEQGASDEDGSGSDRAMLREIGARLHSLRFRAGLTLEAVEEATGISAGSQSKWERGIVEAGVLSLVKLCSFYEVSPDWLLADLSSTRVNRDGNVPGLYAVEGNGSEGKPIQLPTMSGV